MQTLGTGPRYDIDVLRELKTLKGLSKKGIKEAPPAILKHHVSEIMEEINAINLRQQLLDMLDILEADSKLEIK